MPERIFSGQEQVWLVTEIAMFRAHWQVIKDFEEEFGRPVDRRRVNDYDIANPQSRCRRSPELIALFEKSRAEFLAHRWDVAIGKREFRLSVLQEQLEEEMSKDAGKDPEEVRKILEQAAKEVGNAYTNKQELSGPNGGPIQTTAYDLSKLSREEREGLLATLEKATADE